MPTSPYPWRDGRSLGEVIFDSRDWLVKRSIIEDAGGSAEAAIIAAEARLGRPLPDDLRSFHMLVRPIPVRSPRSPDGPKEFGFYRLEEGNLEWAIPTENIRAEDWASTEVLLDWKNVEALLIGQNGWGDTLFRVNGHRTKPDGCIGIFDHEMAMGELQLSIIARSLAEFIAKVVIIGGLTEPFDYDVEEDDVWQPLEYKIGILAAMELVRQEYAELNPSILKRET